LELKVKIWSKLLHLLLESKYHPSFLKYIVIHRSLNRHKFCIKKIWRTICEGLNHNKYVAVWTFTKCQLDLGKKRKTLNICGGQDSHIYVMTYLIVIVFTCHHK